VASADVLAASLAADVLAANAFASLVAAFDCEAAAELAEDKD
jgi:hypothetical protein